MAISVVMAESFIVENSPLSEIHVAKSKTETTVTLVSYDRALLHEFKKQCERIGVSASVISGTGQIIVHLAKGPDFDNKARKFYALLDKFSNQFGHNAQLAGLFAQKLNTPGVVLDIHHMPPQHPSPLNEAQVMEAHLTHPPELDNNGLNAVEVRQRSVPVRPQPTSQAADESRAVRARRMAAIADARREAQEREQGGIQNFPGTIGAVADTDVGRSSGNEHRQARDLRADAAEARARQQAQEDNERVVEQMGLTNEDIPSHYICPISRSIMTDPVYLKNDPSGRAFERSCITRWLTQGHGRHPFNTRSEERYNLSSIVSATELKSDIASWIQDQSSRPTMQR